MLAEPWYRAKKQKLEKLFVAHPWALSDTKADI